MRVLRQIAVFVAAGLLVLAGCKDKDVEEPEEVWCLDFPIDNCSLPDNGDTLRVLAIGNSFTDDPTFYLGDIVEASGIDEKKLCVYVATVGGTDLDYWRSVYESGGRCRLRRVAGCDTVVVREGSLSEVVGQDWDVVVLQQLSTKSGDYVTYNPSLRRLMEKVRRDCPNDSVAFVWQETWSWWKDYGAEGPTEGGGAEDIAMAVCQMVENEGIDIVIPSGEAVQMAREAKIDTVKSMTIDGRHIGRGAGRYLLACTWYESLVAPVFGVSVLGNNQRTFNDTTITDEVALRCQKCAVEAVNRWGERKLVKRNKRKDN